MSLTKSKKRRIQRAINLGDVRCILKDLQISFEEKKQGDLWFKCVNPNHRDRDASAHISCDRTSEYHGKYHCFGCKDSGTTISLVELYLQLDFWESVLWVESRTYPDGVVSPVRQRVKAVKPELPKEFEIYETEEEWNPPYLEYLYYRGITWEQIRKHRIGYCDGGKYKLRVIVPVLLNGELQTWIGRHIWEGKRVTSCPHGKVGLFGSTFASPQRGPAILVEGWADVLALERLGYSNVMSIQTNGLHSIQYEFIKRFEYILVIPDGDSGGKLFVNSLAPFAEHHDFMTVQLPDGMDPAHLANLREGPKILKDAIDNMEEWKPIVEEREVEYRY